MKKSAFCKLFLLISVWAICLFVISCSNDTSGRNAFEKNLLSDFTAKIDYVFYIDDGVISGNGVITKANDLRLDITSPDPYTDISITSTDGSNADMISISYSGIKAQVPRSAMERLVFLMNTMSERTAGFIRGMPNKSFKACEDTFVSKDMPDAIPYELQGIFDNTAYIFIYDSITGVPLEIYGDNGYCRAEIKIKEFKRSINVSEE